MSKPSRQIVTYAIVFFLTLVFSLGWIIYAAHDEPAKGGLGGAVSVAIAFACLFVRRDYGQLAYKAVAETFPELSDKFDQALASLENENENSKLDRTELVSLKNKVDGIIAQIRVNTDGQSRQNWGLAGASIVGTLAWAFGDQLSSAYALHILHRALSVKCGC